MNDIGKKIKAIRLNNGLNQTDFAKRVCITQSHLSSIENGRDYPSKAVICLIELKFGVDMNCLEGNIQNDEE